MAAIVGDGRGDVDTTFGLGRGWHHRRVPADPPPYLTDPDFPYDPGSADAAASANCPTIAQPGQTVWRTARRIAHLDMDAIFFGRPASC